MIRKMAELFYCAIIIAMVSVISCGASCLAEERSVDTIFKYKKELAITDAQEKNLRNILSKLQNYLTAKTEELNRHRAELNKMITDRSKLNKIKAKLRTIARIQADATYKDIASVRAIEKELTPSQMSKWRGMQEEFKKKAQQAQALTSEQKGVIQ